MFISKIRAAGPLILVLASWLTLCWLCHFFLPVAGGQVASPTPQAKQDATDEKTIRALIAQLGDESFDKRDEAQTKLIAVGRPAQALLRQVVKESMDAEVRATATHVLKVILASPGPGFWIPGGNVFDIAFSLDGRSIAVGCADKMVHIYDVKINALRQTLKGHTATVYSVGYSPDGKLLASCSGIWSATLNKSQGEIIIWDLGKGSAEATLKGPVGGLSSVTFSPDGKNLYATGGDGIIRMWDIASRQEIRDGRGHTRPVRKIIFTPDKKHLATAGIDGTVRFWDPNSLKEVRQILAHPNGVGTITFSPDGKYLVTASRANAQPIPGVIKTWDMATFTEKATITGPSSRVLSLAVSPDNKLLAMGGGRNQEFGEVKIFDLATGTERVAFPDHKEWVECLAFSADGKWLASGSGYTRDSPGEVRVWDVKRLVAKGE